MSSTSPKSPRNDEPKAPERRPPTRDAAAPGVEDPFRRIAPREAPPPLLPAQERAWAAALQRAHGNSMATELLLARQAVTNGQAGLPHAELDAHTGGLGRRPGAVDFTSAPVQLRVGDEFRNSAPQEKLSTTSAAKLNTLGQIQDFVGSDKYKSMEVELGKVIFENLAVFSEAIGPVTDWILRYLEATGAASPPPTDFVERFAENLEKERAILGALREKRASGDLKGQLDLHYEFSEDVYTRAGEWTRPERAAIHMRLGLGSAVDPSDLRNAIPEFKNRSRFKANKKARTGDEKWEILSHEHKKDALGDDITTKGGRPILIPSKPNIFGEQAARFGKPIRAGVSGTASDCVAIGRNAGLDDDILWGYSVATAGRMIMFMHHSFDEIFYVLQRHGVAPYDRLTYLLPLSVDLPSAKKLRGNPAFRAWLKTYRRLLGLGPSPDDVRRDGEKAFEPPKEGAVQPKRSSEPVLSSATDVRRAAAEGLTGTPQELPHIGPIQQAFGAYGAIARGIEAHIDGPARAATRAMGAVAYATGKAVAFRAPPDLHTAAHEAAHVVQQRGGVKLSSGIGAAGDAYEQHADAVADAVVAGRSAEALLGQMAGPPGAAITSGTGPAVQLLADDIEREPEPAPLDLDKAPPLSAPRERALNHMLIGKKNTPLPPLSQRDQAVVDTIARNVAEGKYVDEGAEKMGRDLKQLSRRATGEKSKASYKVAVYMSIVRGLEARGLEADLVPLPLTNQRLRIGGDGVVGVFVAKTVTDAERAELEEGITRMNQGLNAGRSAIRFKSVSDQGAAQIFLQGLTKKEAAEKGGALQGRATPRPQGRGFDVHIRLRTKKKPNKTVIDTVVHELLHTLGVDHFEQHPLVGPLRVFGNSAFRHQAARAKFNPGAASSGLTLRDVQAVNKNYPQFVLVGPPSLAG